MNQVEAYKKWVIRSTIVFLVILSVVGGIRLSMLSDWLRNYVVSSAQKSVYEFTGAQLTIEMHDGDLYKGIRLDDVMLIKIDTLISAQTIYVEYNLWPLVKKTLAIGKLQIDGLKIHIEQDSAGATNFETLIPQTDEPTENESFWNVLLPEIYLNNGSVAYRSTDGYFVDSLTMNGITASGSFRSLGSQWNGHLRSLQFEANYAALAEVFGITMSANAANEIINLESLLIHYGKSMANATATYAIDQDSLHTHIRIEPIALDDVNAIVEPIMARNLNAELSIRNSLKGFETSVYLFDGNKELIHVVACVGKRDSLYGLTYVLATSPGLKIGDYVLAPDYEDVQFEGTEVTYVGWAPFGDMDAVEGDAMIRTKNVMFESYRVGIFEANISNRHDQTLIDYVLRTGFNRLEGRFEALNIYTDAVRWSTQLTANVHDLRQLDVSQTLPISFSSRLNAMGTGLTLNVMNSSFSGLFTDVLAGGREIDRIDILGRINDVLYLDSLVVEIGNGHLSASGSSSLDFELPVYEVEISTTHIDLSDLTGFEQLKTDLNATSRISGIGYSDLNRNISLELNVDSSWVNQTKINAVDANVVLAGNRLFIEDATISSEIADGRFGGDLDIDDLFRPSNNMVFNLVLKNLQPLAAFVGVDHLSAKGEIRGRIEQGAESPELVAIVALDDVAYDSLTVRRVVGQYVMPIQTTPTYLAELELISPNLNGTLLDDIRFSTRGKITGRDLSGQISIDLNVLGESGIRLAGAYTYKSDTLRLSTSSFDIRGPTRTFRQQSNFNLTYTDGAIQSDTLILRAEPDAHLTVHVRYLSADSTALWLDAQNVNLEVLQTGLMVDPRVEGYITGNVSIVYADKNLALEAALDLWNLSWEDLKIDRALVRATLANDNLVGSLHAISNRRVLFDATINLPFKLGDPNEFGSDFYDQPVHATLVIDSLNLSDYGNLFEQIGYPQLTGTIKASSKLSGIARTPVLTGGVTFLDGSIAGIPVDMIELGWNYNQSLRQLSCSATLLATGQKVFNSSFNIPLNLDLWNFSQLLPELSDPIDGRLYAEGFNLALLSPFLPLEHADQLTGAVNGYIEMGGTFGEPLVDGNLALRNAGVRIVPGNVILRNMATNIVFNRYRIEIDSLTMRSGSGALTANGYISINGFEPGELAFDIKARQFNVSDTRDARLVVSFDSKLAGSMARPELTGSMTVNNASIFLDNFGERTVEDVQLEGEVPVQNPSMYDSLSIRMRVQVDPNVWMRNRTSPELAVELQGDIDVLKDRNSNLMAFGTLGTRQGYAMQYGKRFQMERGQLTFTGDPLNPSLDIISLYELRVPEDIKIRYLIGGKVNEPTFNFSSNPEMELENIISYTLFGKPFGALFSWQQSFSGGRGGNALARDAAIGVLVDRVESLATESLGIDVLQIDSNRLGETITTSVKAGKYITDKLFVAVLNELGGSDAVTRVVLEYYVRRNLLLMVTRGNDLRSGIDILWKYEY